ncbi:MAG: signal peptidase I [Legionella sp.]|nr:signal peptidase I [Legionella sp.]
MSFALLLVILTALTGSIALIDKCYWAKQRDSAAAEPKLVEHARAFFPIFLIVLLLRSFLVEPFRIPSGSLEPTLQVGDFVAVNKFAYGLHLPVLETKILSINNPKTGDIAVFRWPPSPNFDYIKRVIGVPGDVVSYHNKQLIINNKKMPQKFIEYTLDESSGRTVARYQEDLNGVVHDIYINPKDRPIDFDFTVPKGHYFMLGDNRDDSADSRYWGFLPEENLRGRAFFVWMSWNNKKHMPRWENIGHILH